MGIQDEKIVAGHDKYLTVCDMRHKTRCFEKKPEWIRATGNQDFTYVSLDRSGTFLLTASSDKYVTIFDMLNGNVVCKTTCGDVTTSMCLTLDNQYLITTSSEGHIYFWKLHESFIKCLN